METIQSNTYLSFIINNEYFAVNVGKVLEVLLKPKITRVPNAPKDISGVINFRGEIIPAYETRVCFELPDRKADDKLMIIVLEIEKENIKTTIGAIVDKVKDVITIQKNEILAVPKMKSSAKEKFITGFVKLKENYFLILDMDKVFSEQELQEAKALSI